MKKTGMIRRAVAIVAAAAVVLTSGSNYTVFASESETAKNEPISYQIEFKETQNGYISAEKKSYSEKDEVELKIYPDSGYVLTGLSAVSKENKEMELRKFQNSIIFEMPAADVVIESFFEKEQANTESMSETAMETESENQKETTLDSGRSVESDISTESETAKTSEVAKETESETEGLAKVKFKINGEAYAQIAYGGESFNDGLCEIVTDTYELDLSKVRKNKVWVYAQGTGDAGFSDFKLPNGVKAEILKQLDGTGGFVYFEMNLKDLSENKDIIINFTKSDRVSRAASTGDFNLTTTKKLKNLNFEWTGGFPTMWRNKPATGDSAIWGNGTWAIERPALGDLFSLFGVSKPADAKYTNVGVTGNKVYMRCSGVGDRSVDDHDKLSSTEAWIRCVQIKEDGDVSYYTFMIWGANGGRGQTTEGYIQFKRSSADASVKFKKTVDNKAIKTYDIGGAAVTTDIIGNKLKASVAGARFIIYKVNAAGQTKIYKEINPKGKTESEFWSSISSKADYEEVFLQIDTLITDGWTAGNGKPGGEDNPNSKYFKRAAMSDTGSDGYTEDMEIDTSSNAFYFAIERRSPDGLNMGWYDEPAIPKDYGYYYTLFSTRGGKIFTMDADWETGTVAETVTIKDQPILGSVKVKKYFPRKDYNAYGHKWEDFSYLIASKPDFSDAVTVPMKSYVTEIMGLWVNQIYYLKENPKSKPLTDPVGFIPNEKVYSFYITNDNKPVYSDTYSHDVTHPNAVNAYEHEYLGEDTKSNGIVNEETNGFAYIKKVSANPSLTNGNSCYSLEGGVFRLTEVATNKVIEERLITKENGESQTIKLPVGDYYVEEEIAPDNFKRFTGKIRVTLVRDEVKPVLIQNEPSNDPVNIVLNKVDPETKEPVAQGDGSLKDAEYTIEYYDGENLSEADLISRKPLRTWVFATEEDGQIILPSARKIRGDDFYMHNGKRVFLVGTYVIKETKEPEGYLLDPNTYIRHITTDKGTGELVKSYAEPTSPDEIKTGGFKLEKWDNETGKHSPQGGATFKDMKAGIYNRSNLPVVVEGVTYQADEKITTVTLDENGEYVSAPNYLPYGSYEAVEELEPEGYLSTGKLSVTFEIREDGKIVELTGKDAIFNDPMRADVKGVKITDGHRRLANVPFSFTSITTQESHTIVTDANGNMDTSSDWNPHSRDTNRGQTSRDGIWFGEIEKLNDDVGALLYDTYKVDELPCEENEGFELISFFIKVDRHGIVIDLGTITNKEPPEPEIGTTAKLKETGTNYGYVGESTIIIDSVSYKNLTVGKEYSLKGIVMDKESNKPLIVDGKEVISEKSFIADQGKGSIDIEFNINSKALRGKSVVIFESMYHNGKVIASHTDINDSGQTVSFKDPGVETTAKDQQSNDKSAHVSEKTTIIDTVTYYDLILGREYTVKGILMDQKSAKPLLVSGKEITSEMSFIAKRESGTVELAFVLDSSTLQGKSVVVFERLYYQKNEIAVHTDIKDVGQTVSFKDPGVETNASDQESTGNIGHVSEKTTIVDEVGYYDLIPGKKYTIKGILMDQKSEKPLLIDGKEITAQKEFTALHESGTVELSFEFDSTALRGKSVVVFERLYFENIEIAVHADINDQNQTVEFKDPSLKTTASDKTTGKKVISANSSVVIVDKIEYDHLIPGKEYKVVGTLMDKKTGEPLMVGGKEIKVEKKFTPSESKGSIEMEFAINASELSEKEVVVYEKLFYKDREIGSHEDINDEGQTVKFGPKDKKGEPYKSDRKPSDSSIRTSAPKTGDDTQTIFYVTLAVVAVGIFLFIHKKKKRLDNVIKK